MARAGYYAGVTLIDSYIGLVLNKLDELGVADSTIVIHTSDHGYLLGEHAEWAKQTLYDTALRVPLMIRTPGTRIHPISHMESFQGVLTGADSDLVQPPLPPPRTKRIAHGIVELNDLYPTLAELAGLPAPPPSVEGRSFAALVVDQTIDAPFRQFALSQYPRCVTDGIQLDVFHNNTCEGVLPNMFSYMGYSLRTFQWRYTAWFRWDGASCVPEWDEVAGRELYDHRLTSAPGRGENDFGRL